MYICYGGWTSGTLKNICAKGYNRLNIFFSKYIISLCATLIISLMCVLFAYLFGLCAFEHIKPTENVFAIFIGQLLGIIAYHAIFFTVAYSIPKLGASIALCILGPSVISLLFSLADVGIDSAIKDNEITFSNYWLSNIFTNFAGTTNHELVVSGYVLLIIYIAISLFLGVFFNYKRDIK